MSFAPRFNVRSQTPTQFAEAFTCETPNCSRNHAVRVILTGRPPTTNPTPSSPSNVVLIPTVRSATIPLPQSSGHRRPLTAKATEHVRFGFHVFGPSSFSNGVSIFYSPGQLLSGDRVSGPVTISLRYDAA